MAVKNLIIRGGADFSGIQKEMDKTQQALSKFQNKISGTMKKIGNLLSSIAIGKVIKDSTEMAMGVESSIGNINRNMGGHAKEFQNWVNTQAKGYGMATADAYKYGSVFSNLLASFSSSSSETTKQTEELMKATSIIASKTGRTYEDTAERIRSGMLGSTEAIEDLGVYTQVSMLETTNAFKQFANGKSWEQLDFQTQQQIRLAAILEQTYSRYGNELANTTQTAHMQFIASLRNIQLSLGQAFMPIYSFVLPALTTLANIIGKVVNYIAQFTTALFGKPSGVKKQTQAISQQSKATNNLGSANNNAANKAKKAGKEAKKAGKEAKGALAGFDEINSLSLKSNDDPSASGGVGAGNDVGVGGADIGTIPKVDFEGLASGAVEVSAKVQEMANKIKAKIKEVVDFIVKNKEIIISVASGIIAAFSTFETLTFLTTLPQIISGIGISLSVLLTPIGLVSVAIGGLVASFVYLYQTNENFKNSINQAWAEISNTMKGFINNTIKPIFNYIINDFLSPLGKAFKSYILPVLADLFVGISKILNDILKFIQSTVDNIWKIVKPGLDLIRDVVIDFLEIVKKLWDKYGATLINNIREFIQGAQETFQLIWDNIINPIIQPALEMFQWLWDKHLKAVVEEIGAFIMKCVNGALEIYNKFIKPVVDSLIKDFGPPIASVINFLIDLFGSWLAGIADIAKGIIRTLGGIVDFIVGVFTGNWKKAWQGVKDIFGGIWDSLKGTVKVPINYIIDAMNFMIRGLNKLKIDIPDWIPGVGGKTWGINIPNIPKLARGGIVDGPTVAMIGEAGKEAVVPLENNTEWMDKMGSMVANSVLGAMQFSNNSSKEKGDIILQVDGTTFARIINPYAAKENERLGNNMILKTV